MGYRRLFGVCTCAFPVKLLKTVNGSALAGSDLSLCTTGTFLTFMGQFKGNVQTISVAN